MDPIKRLDQKPVNVVPLQRGERPPISSPASHRLLRNHHPMTQWLQWLATISVVLVVLDACTRWIDSPLATTQAYYVGTLAVLLMILVYGIFGVFQRFNGIPRGLLRITVAWGATLLVLATILAVIDPALDDSATVLGTWALLALAGQWIVALAFFLGARIWHRNLRVDLPSLVIGTGWLGRELAQNLNGNAFLSDRVVGFLDEGESRRDDALEGVPVLGTLAELEDVLERQWFDRVYLALPLTRMHEVKSVQERLATRNVDVIWVPDIFSMHLINPSVREVGGLPLIALSESPLISGMRAYLKALMDVTVAFAAVLALSPLMLGVAIAVKLSSPGPVLFRQRREGWDGAPFEIYKFRSMKVHEESDGKVTQAHAGDDRITGVGRILRATSIDELPQLFNVLDGSMSLVGPRPHAISHNRLYAQEINDYLSRHRIKPGITGWAQIHGQRGETRTVADMQRRIRYDLEYINRWSLLLDCYILLMTPIALVRHRGL